jgi:hypothetical protein
MDPQNLRCGECGNVGMDRGFILERFNSGEFELNR